MCGFEMYENRNMLTLCPNGHFPESASMNVSDLLYVPEDSMDSYLIWL
jgi:hypothetical protein